MFRGQRIAVVVPAFNEADKIARTVRSVPGYVDHVLVIDDASGDATGKRARRSQRRGLEVIRHPENRGVGAAIATGYGRALELGADVTAVMAGDSQMDPADLAGLLGAVVEGRADYAKGNRFLWPQGWRVMPPSRLFGNLAALVHHPAGLGLPGGVRLAVRVHGGQPARAGHHRGRADVPPLRLPQRRAGPAGPRRSARCATCRCARCTAATGARVSGSTRWSCR